MLHLSVEFGAFAMPPLRWLYWRAVAHDFQPQPREFEDEKGSLEDRDRSARGPQDPCVRSPLQENLRCLPKGHESQGIRKRPPILRIPFGRSEPPARSCRARTRASQESSTKDEGAYDVQQANL